MKSTTGMKKTAKKGKQTKISNYKFWLVLTCAGLIGVWYMLLVLASFGAATVINSNLAETSPEVYEVLSNVVSALPIYVAALASLPFAIVVFKRLNIEMPVKSAIAFFMAPSFGYTLFAFLSSVVFYEPITRLLVLAISMVIAGLLYGLIIRVLKHRLSTAEFLSLSIGLTFIPIILWVLWRL